MYNIITKKGDFFYILLEISFMELIYLKEKKHVFLSNCII